MPWQWHPHPILIAIVSYAIYPGAMYPEGFHPAWTSHKRDFSGIADYIPRSAVEVKYYLANFWVSVYMDLNSNDPPLVTGTVGWGRDPPELSATEPYDPFKLDIFIFGNMFKKQ